MEKVDKTSIASEPEAADQLTQAGEVHKPDTHGFSRRNFLGVSPTLVATAALAGLTAHAQEAGDTRKAEKDISASDPAQENKPLLDENPSSNMPPPTDLNRSLPRWLRIGGPYRNRRFSLSGQFEAARDALICKKVGFGGHGLCKFDISDASPVVREWSAWAISPRNAMQPCQRNVDRRALYRRWRGPCRE
jgi:hypothetical protein